MAYLGNSPINRLYSTQAITLAQGQTAVNVNYTPGLTLFFRDGALLEPGTDYTASDGSVVTLAQPANAGDVLQVISLAQFAVANALALAGGTMSGPLNVQAAKTATQPAQFGQVAGVVGQSRNLVMSATAASATATLTADEIIVESALGGLRYCLANFNKTINLGTTGAGGMDTGTAPASGFVAIYAIYNPTTGASALLATNATTEKASEVYSGPNMPAGYTASALVSVWQTNASRQFGVAYQQGREYVFAVAEILNTSVQTSVPTALSISALVPKNAKYVRGTNTLAGSSSGSLGWALTSGPLGLGVVTNAQSLTSAGSFNSWFSQVACTEEQTLYYNFNGTSSTVTFTLNLSGYTI